MLPRFIRILTQINTHQVFTSAGHPLYLSAKHARQPGRQCYSTLPGHSVFQEAYVMILPSAESQYYHGDCPATKVLTWGQERQLFSKVRRKVDGAFAQACHQYLRWACKLATTAHGKTSLTGPRFAVDEAISAANSGLVEAIQRYDSRLGSKRGARFTTYAFPIVRRHLIDALIATYPVKVSLYYRNKIELEGSDDTVFDQLFPGMSSEDTVAGWSSRPEDAPFVPVSASDPAEDSNTALLREDVKTFLRTLPKLEREAILSRYYREPTESFRQAARRLEVQTDAVREAHDRALVKLRTKFSSFSNPLAA